MRKGRRFDDEPKLNIKKVLATVIAILVIVMVVSSIIMAINKRSKEQTVPVHIKYFPAYSNSKWTVINSLGEQQAAISYDEMIIVPNSDNNVFIVTYDVDYSNGTYKTKAVNDKNETLFSSYQNISAIENSDVNDVWYDKEVLKFEKDGKYGLIDFTGKEVLAPEYNNIQALQGIEKALVLEKDGKFGLYNSLSKARITEITYDSIEAFGKSYNEGYIVKDSSGKYGLLSAEGKVILPNTYDKIYKAHGSEKYVVDDNLKTKLIDKEGNVILESGFDEITEVIGDAIVVKRAGKYGILTTTGETLIDAAFDTLKYCFGDYYIASTAGNYGIIDIRKDIKVEFKYKDIEYRSDITSLVCENADYTTDIYTRDLTYVFTGTISNVDTNKGYIRARVGDNYKYYNLQYQEISSKDALKDNTLWLVKEDGKYGYVNAEGQKIVDCIYDDAKEQNEFGFAAVNKGGKWGVLQQNGSVLLEPSVAYDNSITIDFIGKWHISEDTELGAYVLGQ